MTADAEPIPVYLLCRDEERIKHWRARADEIRGIDFYLWSGFESIYAFIGRAIAHSTEPIIVVAHDDVIIGRQFGRQVRLLVTELNSSFPNWGLAGNAGVSADGQTYYVYVKDPWSLPQQARGPDVVACIDGNLMLINRGSFLASDCQFPDLGGFHGYDLVLSFECLRRGLLVITDGRLSTVHYTGGNRGSYARFMRSAPFQKYFQARFADDQIPTLLGAQPVLQEFADADRVSSRRPTLQRLVDTALQRAVRPRAHRLGMVRLGQYAGIPLDTVAQLKWPIDIDVIDAWDLGLGGDLATIVQAVLGRVSHDHLWFISPGTRVDPNGLGAVCRAIAASPSALVVGACVRPAVAEQTSAEIIPASRLARAVFAAGTFPLDGLVFPSTPLRAAADRADLWSAFGDGALMAAIAATAPGVRACFLSETIVRLPAEPGAVASPLIAGYGDQADWELIDRRAVLSTIASETNPMLWALAADAALAAPARPARWSQNAAQVFNAAFRVMSQPKQYLGRGLSLTFQYLLRGDIRGLVREARLFRPR